MKQKTKLVILSTTIVLGVVDLVLASKNIKKKYNSEKSLNARINEQVSHPSFTAKNAVNNIAKLSNLPFCTEDKKEEMLEEFGYVGIQRTNPELYKEMYPICKEMYNLGYTVGRRDEIFNNPVCEETAEELIEEYFDNF